MSVPVDPVRLRYEMAIRGLSASDLAREARVSAATISAALAGRSIAETSLRLIAGVLLAVPVDDVIRQLLAAPSTERPAPTTTPAGEL